MTESKNYLNYFGLKTYDEKLKEYVDDKYIKKVDLPEAIISNIDIVNDLTSGGSDKALSAEQGKELTLALTDLANKIATIKDGYKIGDFSQLGNLKAVVEGKFKFEDEWVYSNSQGIGGVKFTKNYDIYLGSYCSVIKLSESGTKLWEYKDTDLLMGNVYALQVDSQGNVYCATTNGGGLVKLSPAGKKIWNFDTRGTNFIIDSDDNIIFNADENLTKISSSGSKLWNISVNDNDDYSLLLVDSDNNIYYISNTKVVKISSSGEKIWELTGSMNEEAAIDSKNNIYFACEDGIEKISSSGDKIWSYPSLSNILNIAIDKEDNVYFDNEEKLIKLSPTGSKIWEIASNYKYSKKITFDDKGYVYYAYDEYFVKITSSGNIIWKTYQPHMGSYISRANGDIYKNTSGIFAKCIENDERKIVGYEVIE